MKTANNTAEARVDMSNTSTPNFVHFVATCPKCRQQVLQHGYTRVLLIGFLDVDHPIEAYCAPCDELWSISAAERRAIGGVLAPAQC